MRGLPFPPDPDVTNEIIGIAAAFIVFKCLFFSLISRRVKGCLIITFGLFYSTVKKKNLEKMKTVVLNLF